MFGVRAGLGVLVASLCVACSWLTDFVVANRSDETIAVVYALQPRGLPYQPPPKEGPWTGCAFELGTPTVAPLALQGWWRPQPQWRELRSDEFAFDEATCQIEVQLLPGQMLRVTREVNYLGPEHPSRIADLRLEIRSPREVVRYAGRQLALRFAKRSDDLYELSHTS